MEVGRAEVVVDLLDVVELLMPVESVVGDALFVTLDWLPVGPTILDEEELTIEPVVLGGPGKVFEVTGRCGPPCP